jgi:hypothetical protein
MHVQIEQRGDTGWWIYLTGSGIHTGPFDTLQKAKVRAYLLYPMALIEVYELDND